MEQEICQFLDNDIQAALGDAVESAVRQKARHKGAVLRIANETSIVINGLLLRAKEEFPHNGEILGRVHELEESYSMEEIFETLRARLGIRFVEGLRSKLTEEILDAVAKFQHEGGPADVDGLLDVIEGWFKKAEQQAKGKFPNEAIYKLVRADLKELKLLYADRDSLARKFEPYSK